MSKRSEEAASAAYPENENYEYIVRPFFQEGYEQAEKDLAMTVEDIKTIIHLYGIVCEEFKGRTLGEIYEEVLRRFNNVTSRKVAKLKVHIHRKWIDGVKYIEVNDSGRPLSPVELRDVVSKYIAEGGEFYNIQSDIPCGMIGQAIAKGVISEKDVEVYLDGLRIYYDCEGGLLNWPIGFFMRESDDECKITKGDEKEL